MQSFEKKKRVIIALHGWTGNIFSLQYLAKHWNFPATDWIYIQGAYKAKPGGYSWFEGNDKEGWKHRNSFQKLTEEIQSLLNYGYQYNQIYILGFSQGACLAMEFMIRQKFSIGAIVAISGFIKHKNEFKKERNILSQNTAVLLLHGEKDNVINPKESKIAYRIFKDLGYKADIHILKGGHKIPLRANKLIKEKIFQSL
ncbi:MAG: alpha/beta hydrolase [Candidatus Neomarinimicrobiota bacterium]